MNNDLEIIHQSTKGPPVTKPGLAVLFWVFLPGIALAHDGTGVLGGFVSGFLHPINGPDHMLAMIAVGLWGAILGRPLVIGLPMVFPAMMAVGGVMGIMGLPLPPVEIGIAISVLLLGSAIAFKINPPVWAALLIVAIFAIFHGYAHGIELPSAADPVGYSVGFVLSTGLLHLVGIGIALALEKTIGLKAVQVCGAIIGLAGLWFLYKAIAG